jgi:hypothetical protein
MRSDEIRSLERSEVIGGEGGRSLFITPPCIVRGKRKCAPAHQLKEGALEAYLILEKGESQNLPPTSCWIEVEHSPPARQQQRGFDSRYTRCGEKD